MKPKLRLTASIDYHFRIVTAAYQAIENARDYPYQTCLHCLNFNEVSEICKLANQRPPARVIVFGCPQFDDIEGIPF